jgi:hypothetical protein
MTEDQRSTAPTNQDEVAVEPTATEGATVPHPLLPDQPVDAERPMPLRAAPERTADPSDWDVAVGESVRTRPSTRPHGAGPDDERDLGEEAPDWVEPQSSYPTDLQQGAANPRAYSDGESEPPSE